MAPIDQLQSRRSDPGMDQTRSMNICSGLLQWLGKFSYPKNLPTFAPAMRDAGSSRPLRSVGVPHVRAMDQIDPEIVAWDLGAGESAVLTWARRHPGFTAILDDCAALRCAESESELRGLRDSARKIPDRHFNAAPAPRRSGGGVRVLRRAASPRPWIRRAGRWLGGGRRRVSRGRRGRPAASASHSKTRSVSVHLTPSLVRAVAMSRVRSLASQFFCASSVIPRRSRSASSSKARTFSRPAESADCASAWTSSA